MKKTIIICLAISFVVAVLCRSLEGSQFETYFLVSAILWVVASFIFASLIGDSVEVDCTPPVLIVTVVSFVTLLSVTSYIGNLVANITV
jgi:hypothetical protein